MFLTPFFTTYTYYNFLITYIKMIRNKYISRFFHLFSPQFSHYIQKYKIHKKKKFKKSIELRFNNNFKKTKLFLIITLLQFLINKHESRMQERRHFTVSFIFLIAIFTLCIYTHVKKDSQKIHFRTVS